MQQGVWQNALDRVFSLLLLSCLSLTSFDCTASLYLLISVQYKRYFTKVKKRKRNEGDKQLSLIYMLCIHIYGYKQRRATQNIHKVCQYCMYKMLILYIFNSTIGGKQVVVSSMYVFLMSLIDINMYMQAKESNTIRSQSLSV